MSISAIRGASNQVAGEVVAFAQRLIQTPSLSGGEGRVARVIFEEMVKLGYDEVFVDDMGNVVGIIKGSGEGRNLMLNCHMDHVDPGRPEAWRYEPYGGTIEGGFLHGRGACDVKGAIASQVYGAALLKRLNLPLKGDLIVAGVVQEEPAEALGTRYLCDVTLAGRGTRLDFVVLGEPSGLNVCLGHRGRVELEVETVGRTSHGSAPWRGINAVYKMLPVIERVQAMAPRLPSHPLLGQSTLALTIISCSPGRLSVVPDLCTISLDRRFLPEETLEGILAQLEATLREIGERDPDFNASVRVREVEETSYNGMKQLAQKVLVPWITPRDVPGVVKACAALRELGQSPTLGYWDFATDGSHTAGVLGIPTIGYAPGEEQYAHTPLDRVRIAYLAEATAGYGAMAWAISDEG